MSISLMIFIHHNSSIVLFLLNIKRYFFLQYPLILQQGHYYIHPAFKSARYQIRSYVLNTRSQQLFYLNEIRVVSDFLPNSFHGQLCGWSAPPSPQIFWSG